MSIQRPRYVDISGLQRRLRLFAMTMRRIVEQTSDFDTYETHSAFYIVTLVFHDQAADITPYLSRLQTVMRQCGLPDYAIHAGSLIRKEY